MRHTASRKPRFDREWKEMIAMLPEHRQASMEASIRAYQMSGTMPSKLDGAEMMAFLLIKKIVDRRAKQRASRLRKRTSANHSRDIDMRSQEISTTKASSNELSVARIAKPKCGYHSKPHTSTERQRSIVRRFNKLKSRHVR